MQKLQRGRLVKSFPLQEEEEVELQTEAVEYSADLRTVNSTSGEGGGAEEAEEVLVAAEQEHGGALFSEDEQEEQAEMSSGFFTQSGFFGEEERTGTLGLEAEEVEFED